MRYLQIPLPISLLQEVSFDGIYKGQLVALFYVYRLLRSLVGSLHT